MGVQQETDLYPPIKSFLEAQGYTVKAEVGTADVVAVRADEPPVIVELKVGFSLTLVHQCIARQHVTDDVYMAVSRGTGKRFQTALKQMQSLCRRLGLGLITVRLRDGLVQVHCDPDTFLPRRRPERARVLLKEFAKRSGDPNRGGQVRSGLVTAYRQDALRLAIFLHEMGASKGAEVAAATGVTHATRMMRDNHYGWFERISQGVYGLSPSGASAVADAGDAFDG